MLVKNSSKLKRLFIVLFLAIVLFCTNLCFIFYGHKSFVFAESSITNGEFDGSSSTLATPSSSQFEAITGAGYSNKELVTTGIANLTAADYLKYPRRYNADQSLNKYVLLISSTTKRSMKEEGDNNTSSNVDVETSHNVKFGYKTSYSLNLDKNSFYKFSVFINTSNRDGIGTFSLLDANNNDIVLLEKSAISTPKGSWYEYNLLVATDNLESLKVKPAMILNGNGDILFDSLSMQKINEQEYNTLLSNPNNVALDKRTVSNEVSGKDLSFAGTTQTNANVKDLVLNFNQTTAEAEFKKADNSDYSFTFNRHLINRVIVTLKTENSSGSATLKLAPKDNPTDEKVASLAISSSADYSLYEFWVKSSQTDANEYVLKLNTSGFSGKLYIYSVESQICTSAQYSSTTTGNNISKLDLSSSTTSSSPYVTNGEFNNASVTDAANPYPLNAENWTFTQSGYSDNQYYGIVNLADTALYKQNNLPFYVHLPSYDANMKKGNVLMLYPATGEISAFSGSSSLSTGYAKFSLDIYTLSKAKVEVLLRSNNDCSLCSLDVYNNNGQWQNVSLYVKAADASANLVVKISTSTSTTFVDNVKFETDVTEQEFINAAAKADLSDLIDTNYYAAENVNLSVVNAKIYNYGDADLTAKLQAEANGWDNEKALRINLNEFGMGSVSTKIGFNLASGKYYILSFSLFTNVVSSNADENGLNIAFSGYENNTFENVVAEKNFVSYTYYVKASADKTSNLIINFGNEDVRLKGELFIGNIKFNSLDYTDSQFNKLAENSTTKILATELDENQDDTNTDDTTESKNKINWRGLPYVISSILFALTIIVAVVGIILRKVKFKKPAKKTKNEYDRNKTVSKQYYARKAMQLKEEKLAELNSELKTLTDERTKYEETYKADLSKLREMKIRRANKSDISKLEKELKQNQKASASIGINIARVESDIAYVNSASYMASITKRLESEAQATGVVEEIEQTEQDSTTEETKPATTASKTKNAKTNTAKKATKSTGKSLDKTDAAKSDEEGKKSTKRTTKSKSDKPKAE